MIIRTTLSRWVMCSDLSFPSLCFSITPVVSGAAAVLIRSVCPTVWVCGEEPSRLLQCIHIGRAECEDQRGHGCDAFPDLFHWKCVPQAGPGFAGSRHHRNIPKRFGRGNVTEKEQALWKFVLTEYGEGQFSTKQLEKDFGNAAYATIRGFVFKFEKLGLLRSSKYGNRIKYQIAK